MSFADKVALCPQRTSAILTKYSSLRSFYEKSIHGSPLDYENAGVYSSALLDAYMDYKATWKELQTMSWQVRNSRAILNKQQEHGEMKLIADAAQVDYKKQVVAYDENTKPDSGDDRGLVRYGKPTSGAVAHNLSRPIPPNAMAVYEPSVFGLDTAQ
jgi:hypothetical protein